MYFRDNNKPPTETVSVLFTKTRPCEGFRTPLYSLKLCSGKNTWQI